VKRLLFLAVFVISILALTSLCYALGDATTYKMTIQSVQLKSSTTGSWVTIATPNTEVDIVGDASGQNSVAATISGGIAIPTGSYDNFKMVISETMTIAGSDGANLTAASGAVTIGGGANSETTVNWGGFPPPNTTLTETVNSYSAAAVGEVTFTLDLDAGDADNYIEVYRNGDLGTPITVTATSVVSMWFDFDTQNTIVFVPAAGVGGGDTDLGADGIMTFSPPQSGTSFSITVDGTTTTITEAQMRIDF